ncbi:MAG: endonuclease Q family protein [Candidatus Goldbacteria bacterium]|nr:endonuclease Q family protein [Candidatus Goldiibacteriota bacterium]
MRIIVDFHIHSKYSRATSKDMDIVNIVSWADKKGIGIIGSGDFQHPSYFGELKNKLEPAEPGLFKLKKGQSKARVILSTEIANIYKYGGKVRKIHTLIFMPDIYAAEKFSKLLAEKGNTDADGRPILGFSVEELVKITLDICADAMIVPAHAWTPWFSVFGSKSGFDSLEECFGKYTKYIKAIETGLSSDPSSNWRISALDSVSLISNSDAHSLRKIGREANVFDCDMDYYEIKKIIETKDKKRFLFTIEFFPEEGKYHYDGHRLCGVSYHPREAIALKNKCPVCFKTLTLGVLHRIEELADRPWDYVPPYAIPQKHLIQLEEIIADALNLDPQSKKVQYEYEKILSKCGTEFEVLLDLDEEQLQKNIPDKRIIEGIMKMRREEVNIIPGFDGEYGKISIFRKIEKTKEKKDIQMTMFGE